MAKRHEQTRERAKSLRTNMTPPEAKLWAELRAGKLGVKFKRQVVIAPYIADFAAPSRKLVIEIDGDSHGPRAAYDRARSAAIAERGYRVIRFTNHEVTENIEGVVRQILIELGSDPDSPLSPTLSP